MMGAFTFAAGFLLSLFFVVLVVVVGRNFLGWGDDALMVWIGSMYCIAGGRDFQRRCNIS